MRANFPKVILCQAKIESDDYSSTLFKRNNNLFGMKTSTNRVTTSGEGRAGYKSYLNWRESVTDMALWQLSHKIDKMSQDDYINFLGKIYAEDPKYSSKIRAMLSKINFKQLENDFESNQ
jgi:flagellum-specific peptidoglycan hydrolase FlgJ